RPLCVSRGLGDVFMRLLYLASLDDSAVTLSIRAWVRSDDFWGVFFDMNETIYNRLPERAGVSFPFPQVDVHMN
ncbi:MAG: hypothetical protein K2I24_08870, partial [Duncaniella sp.]|nr:hypothetical protein [Duncaniella sp.]